LIKKIKYKTEISAFWFLVWIIFENQNDAILVKAQMRDIIVNRATSVHSVNMTYLQIARLKSQLAVVRLKLDHLPLIVIAA